MIFKVSKALAKVDFERWENKKGERQNKNKEYSCLVGILAERAVEIHLNKHRSHIIKQNIMNGIKERESGKFIGNGDIICKTELKDWKIEVKGITKGQNMGQITVYHTDKYVKENTDLVFFVEIKVYSEFAECNVYHIDSVDTIKNNKMRYCIAKNHYGDNCYTFKTTKKGQ